MTQLVNDLAQAIRVADGQHKLGAGRLAEELLPFVEHYANARAAEALRIVGNALASQVELADGAEKLAYSRSATICRGVANGLESQ